MADVLTQDSPKTDAPTAIEGQTLTGIGKPTYTEVHAFWLAGMSCDGCTIGVSGATKPSVEELLLGTIPGLPKIILHHPVLAVEAGHDFTEWYYKAWRGELDAPYVMVLEGSVPDERLNAENGGYWSGLGAEIPEGGDEFDVRTATLGHIQQGGNPTPFDRIQAARLDANCIQYLEDQAVSRLKQEKRKIILPEEFKK